MKKNVLTVSCMLALSACNQMPPDVYYNRGDPENLLDVSSEVVSLSLASSSAGELETMVSQDPPARAELSCDPAAKACKQAKQVFDKYQVASEWAPGAPDEVRLVYNRIVARDCENRYINNSINPYNLSHPTHGCSITGNMVQMVSDKRQFVSPNLLDFQDGEIAAKAYEKYLNPPASSGESGSLSSITGSK